jgi:hypothetical protein
VLGADAKLSRHRPFSGDRFKLAALFALDSFAGGFVMQTFAAYWFHLRFGADPATLGLIFFGANILAGLSAFWASRLASRFGLVNTMVFTHLPSNIRELPAHMRDSRDGFLVGSVCGGSSSSDDAGSSSGSKRPGATAAAV